MMAQMARKNDDAQEVALGQRIATNIQALLRAKGLTQGQLAAYAGLPQSSISALVVGRRNPSLLSVWKISQALSVEVDELAGFKPLQIPETVSGDTQSDPVLAERMNTLESGLQNMREELLEMAKRQQVVLEAIQAEQSGSRKRSKPA